MRPFYRLLIAVVSVLFLPSVLQADPAAPAKLFPLTLQLDWTYDAQFAGFLFAKRQGYYADAGLDVKILPVDQNMTTSKIVTSKPNVIGVAEADILIVDRSKGMPIKAFATTFQSTPFALISLKSSGITSIKQLKGKKLGLHGDGQKAIDVILRYNGLTKKDVTIVDIPYSLDALTSGKVDAMQGYTSDEVVQLELAKHPVNVMLMSDNGYVSYAEVLFTSDATLKKSPDQLSKFISASRLGWDYVKAHPSTAAAILATEFKADGGKEVQLKELSKVFPLINYETQNDRFGWMSPDTWAKSMDMFIKYQFLTKPLQVSDVVDYSILAKTYPNPM